MAIGQGALMSHFSYIGIGRETTYGTGVTCTAGLNFLSASLKTTKELKVLEEIQNSRTNSNFISLGKKIEGDIEFYFSPVNAASNYLLHNAFGGGSISSATATGETIGGAAMTHTVVVNNFDGTFASLSINHRKGDSTTGKIFEYSGVRVNEFNFSAAYEEPLIASASLIGKDSTITTNDISSVVGVYTQNPLSFVNGRLSFESSEASLTSTSFWHVQKFDFKITNDLKADASSRRIGSDVLSVLPAGMAKFELSCELRFDTTTSFDAMISGTKFAGEFEFLGDTMTGSKHREGIKITMANLRVMDAGDPEIGGPGEPLKSNVTFAVLRDGTSATGYAVKAFVTNNTLSYL